MESFLNVNTDILDSKEENQNTMLTEGDSLVPDENAPLEDEG